MKKEESIYAVQVKETLTKTVLVKGAKDINDAVQKVEDAYGQSEIVLTADDYDDEVDISISPCWLNGVFTGDSRDRKAFQVIEGEKGKNI